MPTSIAPSLAAACWSLAVSRAWFTDTRSSAPSSCAPSSPHRARLNASAAILAISRSLTSTTRWSAWLELTIRFRTTPIFRGPLVERAVIGVNGDAEPLVWLETGASLREGEPLQARINLGHPLLATEAHALPGAIVTEADGTQRPLTARHAPADVTDAWEQIAVPEEVLHQALEAEGDGYGGGSGSAGIGDGSGFGDGRSLPAFALSRSRLSALPPPGEPLRVVPFGDDSPEKTAAAAQVRTFLEMVVLGTTAQLASFLRDAMYIGPLRTIPPRGFLYERAGRITS
jgi:hypothetical protein